VFFLSRAAVVCAVGLAAQACLVGSLHPAYDADAIVFDESLVGRWEIRESEVAVAVERGEWRSYEVAYTDRFGTTKFTAHLTKVGNARFLNVRPEDGLERPAFLVATNGILQIEIAADQLRVREPDYATVLKRLNAGKLGIDAATDLKQNVVLTAPTAKVRTWLLAALKDETLWAEWKAFARSSK
jgi:hypothetical protein